MAFGIGERPLPPEPIIQQALENIGFPESGLGARRRGAQTSAHGGAQHVHRRACPCPGIGACRPISKSAAPATTGADACPGACGTGLSTPPAPRKKKNRKKNFFVFRFASKSSATRRSWPAASPR